MVLDAAQVAQTGGGQGAPSQGSTPSTQEAQSTGGAPAGQPAPARPPSSPAPPASGQGSGRPGETGGSAETGQAPADQAPPREPTPEEILDQHPSLRRYLESRAGDIGERRAKELADARIAEMQRNADIQRQLEHRRQLRRDDPEAFARYDEEQEERWRTENTVASTVRAQATGEFFRSFDNMLFEIQFSLPEAAQNEVAGKTFRDPTGDPWKSRQLYLKALNAAAIKHGVNGAVGSALTRAREDITEAARLEANGQQRGGHPTLDTRSGDAPSSGYVTQDEFDRFGRGHSSEARAWRKENSARLQAGLESGRITQ